MRAKYKSGLDKAYVIAQKKRAIEEAKHEKRMTQIHKEYLSAIYKKRDR